MSAEGRYGLGGGAEPGELSPPELAIAPPSVDAPLPMIGLIGCGGISESHLAAYKRLGLPVVALCNRDISKAQLRAEEFFPEAAVFASHSELLALPEVEIVDVATHPEGRSLLISDSLLAGKHVLSQKPFVLDLSQGEALVELARERKLHLAVNQNGRWAPHLAGIRSAVTQGLVGELETIDASVYWDHSWTVGTAFDETEHLVLFDFGIHWFDLVSSLIGDREVVEVSASTAFSVGQRSPQPMLAFVEMLGEGFSVRLRFHGDSRHLQRDSTVVVGAEGALVSEGLDLQSQRLLLHTATGSGEIPLEGDWFTTGFEGAMCELISAVQEGREPSHGAAGNLRGLELAFAACESANTSAPVRPGAVRSFPSEA